MRRVIGIAILAVSVIAGITLLAAGNLGSSRLLASGETSSSRWAVIQFDPNWWLAVPLATCFVVGLLCALLPQRRQHSGSA